jgi:hypothetical protein
MKTQTVSTPESSFSSTELAERTVHRRAVEAIIWGIPVVNFDLMFQAMVKAKGAVNQILYWSRPSDWKNQFLTPNPDTIYFMPFFSTKDAGPMVLEILPADDGSITGTIMDCWQMALEDVGPAGVDKGKGGKYLILSPGYKDKLPEGYIALPSYTYQGYALLRSILKSRDDADIAKAVEYGKRIKLYPLSAAAKPPETTFIDAVGVVVDGVIPYDVRFFQSLDRMVQAELWLERDRVMIDPLKTLGIEKGKPFKPDSKTADILKAAAQEALTLFDVRYETGYAPYNEGNHWFLPADKDLMESVENGFSKTEVYPTDGRGTLFYFAYTTVKHLGAGQFYLFVSRDKDGNPLDGSATYRLHVPPNPPVRQYWSTVLYDFATHALIRNMPHASRSSQSPGLQTNPDGSVDVYFAPKAPARKESNWVPTNAKGRFEALFRFYGPEKPLFEKTWVLPDIEKIG